MKTSTETSIRSFTDEEPQQERIVKDRVSLADVKINEIFTAINININTFTACVSRSQMCWFGRGRRFGSTTGVFLAFPGESKTKRCIFVIPEGAAASAAVNRLCFPTLERCPVSRS